jgi:hypothetical protein
MNATRTTVRILVVSLLAIGSLARADTPATDEAAAALRRFVAFFDCELHTLDENGRSCADCHMLTDHFQLSPARWNRAASTNLPSGGNNRSPGPRRTRRT